MKRERDDSFGGLSHKRVVFIYEEEFGAIQLIIYMQELVF